MWSGALGNKSGSSKGLHFAANNNNINTNHSCLAIASQRTNQGTKKQQTNDGT